MNIIIDAGLSEPPSEIACFRDVTLYGTCFLNANVLVECQSAMKDIYYQWLKSHGAYDFIKEIVKPQEELGFRIGYEGSNFLIERITVHNLNMIITRLDSLRN